MGNSPSREVRGNLLVSEDLPPLTLKIDSAMGFIGRLQFVLYDVAEADIFVFAEADAERILKRWLVVQFEGYLESNSHTYDYRLPASTMLGSHEYMFDDYVADLRVSRGRPGSDGARVHGLLEEKGYVLPDNSIRVRYVRILDDARRREVLIIYTEDLNALGFTAAGLSADGWLPPEHSGLAEGLHERALKTFTAQDG